MLSGDPLQPLSGENDGAEVGKCKRGLEGPSSSISSKNNNHGNEDVRLGRSLGTLVDPAYKDVREVLDARERKTDGVSKRDY